MKIRFKKIYGALVSVALTIGAAFVFTHDDPVKRHEVEVNAAAVNWVKVTSVSDFVNDGKYLLTIYDSYLKPGAYSANPPHNKYDLNTLTESAAWTFLDKGSGNWHITDGKNYLKITADNTKSLRTQTTAPTVYFTITEKGTDTFVLQTTATGNRAPGHQSTGTDWRSYDIQNSYTFLTIYKWTVSAKTLTSIARTGNPVKTSYYDGESFDPTGMTVTAYYSHGTNANVSNYVKYTPNPLQVGNTSVTGSYTEGTITKTFTVTGLTVTKATFSLGTYTVSSTTSVTQSGDVPAGSSATFKNTYTGTAAQITGGNSHTLTLNGYTKVKITELKLSMKSNSGTGAGKLEYSINNGASYETIVADNPFNNAAWNGAWTTSYVDIVKPVNIVPSTGNLILKVTASANSIYVNSYTLKWEEVQEDPLESLMISAPDTTVFRGFTVQLGVTPTPATANPSVTWTSSDTTKATVDTTGLVSAKSTGTVTITATSTVNSAIKDSITLTIIWPYPLEQVTSNDSISFGATYTLSSGEMLQ